MGGGDKAYIVPPDCRFPSSCLAGHSTVTIVYNNSSSEDQGNPLFMKAGTRRLKESEILAGPKTTRDVVNPDFRNVRKGIGCLDCS